MGEAKLREQRFREIFEEAKRNRDKLDACPAHRFPEWLTEPAQIRLGEKLTCQNCGGEMDLVAINYYCRGWAAAGRDPNEVLPGWGPI